MRLALILTVLAACGNGNGFHDVKGGDADQDIDVHDIQHGVWHCVSIAGPDWDEIPCFETLAQCESNRVGALGNGYDVGNCGRQSFSVCYYGTGTTTFRKCRSTRARCEARRKQSLAKGYDVTDCKRVPPKSSKPSSHRLRRPRSWRTARRR